MKKYYELRPHHGMCIEYFRGNGYSREFTVHMKEMIQIFREEPQTLIKVCLHTDELCSVCPNNCSGVCTTEDKVQRYDNMVLEACNLEDGMELEVQEFFRIVKDEILHAGKREKICKDCAWNEICAGIEAETIAGGY